MTFLCLCDFFLGVVKAFFFFFLAPPNSSISTSKVHSILLTSFRYRLVVRTQKEWRLHPNSGPCIQVGTSLNRHLLGSRFCIFAELMSLGYLSDSTVSVVAIVRAKVLPSRARTKSCILEIIMINYIHSLISIILEIQCYFRRVCIAHVMC